MSPAAHPTAQRPLSSACGRVRAVARSHHVSVRPKARPEPRPAALPSIRFAVREGRTGGPGALNAGAARLSLVYPFQSTAAPASGVATGASVRRRRWA